VVGDGTNFVTNSGREDEFCHVSLAGGCSGLESVRVQIPPLPGMTKPRGHLGALEEAPPHPLLDSLPNQVAGVLRAAQSRIVRSGIVTGIAPTQDRSFLAR
jgi:hypothetical protein